MTRKSSVSDQVFPHERGVATRWYEAILPRRDGSRDNKGCPRPLRTLNKADTQTQAQFERHCNNECVNRAECNAYAMFPGVKCQLCESELTDDLSEEDAVGGAQGFIMHGRTIVPPKAT